MMTHAICRKIELCLIPIFQAIVKEELIDPKMAVRQELVLTFQDVQSHLPCIVGHLIDTRVREVGEDIGIIETGHCDLRDDHLREGGEGTEVVN